MAAPGLVQLFAFGAVWLTIAIRLFRVLIVSRPTFTVLAPVPFSITVPLAVFQLSGNRFSSVVWQTLPSPFQGAPVLPHEKLTTLASQSTARAARSRQRDHAELPILRPLEPAVLRLREKPDRVLTIGRRTCAPAAGRVCPITRSVRPPRVRLALRRAIVVGLPVAAGGAGCPRPGRDAPLGGPVIPATGIAGFASSCDGRTDGTTTEVRPHSSLGYLTPAEFKAQPRADGDDGGRSPTDAGSR